MKLGRLAGARVVRGGGVLTLIHPDGSVSRLDDASAALAEAVLDLFEGGGRTRDEVVVAIAEQADGPFNATVIDELLALLARAGVLGPWREARAQERPGGLRVVLGVTGAAQAMETPRLVRLLQQRGHTVRVAVSKAAKRFVSLPMLAALTHARPATGLWGAPDRPAAHVDLAAWADVVLVYPASATTLSRIATGDFRCVVAATALTTRAPVILAPSMSPGMLRAPAVARNLATLRDDGFHLVEPGAGVEVAELPDARAAVWGGALAPEQIVDVVAAVAARPTPPRTDWSRWGLRPQTPPDRFASDWNAAYSGANSPPWHVDAPPPDLAKALAALSPQTVLDVGTGLGTVAIYAAQLGHRVVATDVAQIALTRARARAGDLPIVFVRDDVTRTRLVGPFDAAVDRGCLHVLPPQQHAAYAETLARLVRPGGALLLVGDGSSATADRGTVRMSPPEMALALPMFDLERATPTTLTPDEPGAAWLTIWRRRAA